MKKFIYVILFLFIYISSFSQVSKGFVILNNDERVDGLISLRSENRNPTKIKFSRHQSFKEVVTYTVSDLKSFEVADVDRYIRAHVSTDIRPFNNAVQIAAKLDSFRTETVWLREVATGEHVSLYELYDTRSHYFINDSTGGFKELIYKVGRESDRPYDMKLYINQLQQYREKYNPQSSVSFMKTRFTQYDLVKAVNNINGDSTKENAAMNRDTKIHYSVFAGAGVGTAKTKLTGVYENIGDVNFKNQIFPFAVAGIDFYPGRKPGRVAIRIDIAYNSVTHKGTSTHPLYRDAFYEVKQTNIIPSFTALFNFVNQQNLKFYFGPSVSYHLSSYKGNEYVFSYPSEFHLKDYLDLDKTWVSFDARLGAKINHVLEISLRGELAGVQQRNAAYKFSARQYTLGVAYHFLRKL